MPSDGKSSHWDCFWQGEIKNHPKYCNRPREWWFWWITNAFKSFICGCKHFCLIFRCCTAWWRKFKEDGSHILELKSILTDTCFFSSLNIVWMTESSVHILQCKTSHCHFKPVSIFSIDERFNNFSWVLIIMRCHFNSIF